MDIFARQHELTRIAQLDNFTNIALERHVQFPSKAFWSMIVWLAKIYGWLQETDHILKYKHSFEMTGINLVRFHVTCNILDN